MATSTKMKSQRKADTIIRFDPTNYPLTWLRVVRLFVQFVVSAVLLFGASILTVTWLTLPVAAPPTSTSISQGALYILQLLVVNAVFPFLPLAFIFITGAIFGRLFCGWTCPYGFIQELLALLPVKKINVSKATNKALSEIAQYLAGGLIVFIIFIGLFELFGGSGAQNQLSETFGILAVDPLTSLDPPATLFTFIPAIFQDDPARVIDNFGSLDIWFWVRISILVFALIIPIFVPRAFCRYFCVIGAVMGKFQQHSLVAVQREAGKCNECTECESICPMGVKILDYPDRIRDSMCIQCMDCAYACKEGAIQLKIG